MEENYTSNNFSKSHLKETEISMYAEALIHGEELALPLIIRNHVADCPQCKKEIFAVFDFMRKHGAFKGNSEKSYTSDDFNKGSNITKFNTKKLLKVAAIVFIVVGLGGLLTYYLIASKSNQSVSTGQTFNSAKSNANKKELPTNNKEGVKIEKPSKSTSPYYNNEVALNVRESEFFENLIKSGYRSIDIEILSPSSGQQFLTPQRVLFKFKGNISFPLLIKIYNNKDNKVFEKANIITTDYVLEAKLPYGLYYWKLERRNTLLYIGKFYIK